MSEPAGSPPLAVAGRQDGSRDRSRDFLSGGGLMGAMMRAHDWSASAVGEPSTWPQSLRTVVGLMINSRHPMFVAWGPQLTFLYNDGYQPILGVKHPDALGRPFQEVWSEIWDDIRPLIGRALEGKPTWSENLHLVMERSGVPEDTWYTFSYSPVHDESGGVAGMFCACTETTGQVVAERSARFRLRLENSLRELDDPIDILATAQAALGEYLGAGRAGYGELDAESRFITVQRDWANGVMASLAGETRPLDGFGPAAAETLRAGRTLVLTDVAADAGVLNPQAAAAFDSIGARSMIVAPLIKAGRLTAILYVHSAAPRLWSSEDVALVEQVAERTWAEGERARAEAARRAIEDALHRQLAAETQRLREMFEQAPSFMALLRGPDHVFELANPRYQSLVSRTDIVGKPAREALPEVVSQGFIELLDEVYRSGRPFIGRGVRVALARPDGALTGRLLDFVYQPICDANGDVDGIFVEGFDVTEQREADERLRIAQRAGRIGAFEWFPDTGRMEVTPEYRTLFGLTADEEVTAEKLVGLVLQEDRPTTGPGRLGEIQNPLQYAEYRIRRPDSGEVRWIARQGEAVLSDSHSDRRFLGVAFDITERKQAEAALRELNETLEQRVAGALAERKLWADVFEESDDLVAVIDFDFNWLALNRASADHFERLYGVRPKAGDNMLTLMSSVPEHQLAVRSLWARALAGETFITVGAFGPPGAQPAPFELKFSPLCGRDGKPIGAVQFSRDITERVLGDERLRQAEEALRQSQKMEAVGQLTGGIAHDFNNLLQGIIGSLDFVRKRVGQGRTDDLDRFINGAMTSANRAAALTHRLLAFSRRQPLNPRPVQANPLIESMQDLLRRTLGEGVTLELDLESDLWLTLADANQLESAVLNLAINARDAMPEGGRLQIKTCNVQLEEEQLTRLGLRPGDYVCIHVQDSGVGMSADVAERAFDPFFTTKPIGQGTGLGLSMIYGFTRQSDGAAEIDTEVGRGTEVKLFLPRHLGEAVEDDAPADAFLATGAGEVVLVVEDEPVVRNLIVEILSDLGYRSLQAEDGSTALALLQSAQRVDLLVTDIGLPGLNGRQVADAAREFRPGLKVLLMTGYAENAAAQGADFLESGMGIITKPFANEAIGKMIQDMLLEPPHS